MNKLIVITGGSASGKTTVANEIIKACNGKAVLISQDSFYKFNNAPEANYDIPEAFDFEMQNKVISSLLNNEPISAPIYNFSEHKPNGMKMIEPAEYIILEGLFVMNDPYISAMADFKIFVDTPSDTRLARRIRRDVGARGRDLNEIIERWSKDVQPSYLKFISPVKTKVDIVIPWLATNSNSLKSILVTMAHLSKQFEF